LSFCWPWCKCKVVPPDPATAAIEDAAIERREKLVAEMYKQTLEAAERFRTTQRSAYCIPETLQDTFHTAVSNL
jgi:hypothetical protein